MKKIALGIILGSVMMGGAAHAQAADPQRLGAIIQQLSTQAHNASDQAAVEAADLAIAQNKVATLQKQVSDLTAENAKLKAPAKSNAIPGAPKPEKNPQ